MNIATPPRPAVIELSPREETQCQLHRLASAALAATTRVDETGSFLTTPAGIALVHAIHDLIEVDAVYDLAADLEAQVATPPDYAEHRADVRWARSVRS